MPPNLYRSLASKANSSIRAPPCHLIRQTTLLPGRDPLERTRSITTPAQTNPLSTTTMTNPTSDSDLNPSERSTLLARISELESLLHLQKVQLEQTRTASHRRDLSPSSAKRKKQPNVFDPSAYHTRRIALKFSYLGHNYNGYEHANNISSAPPKPTIEEVLWKALRKARLISPELTEGADASYEVVWDERDRAARYGAGNEGAGKGKRGSERLELNWEGCEYSKCGRTDRGVSAFGQVVGVTVRSSRPKSRDSMEEEERKTDGSEDEATSTSAKEWDSVRDELPYISILNSLLPPSIRVLAWCPNPPSDWDARFACRERRYKYFFTNPAFCPTPGPLGFKDNKGRDTKFREGWLDIEAMRIAAKKLEGLHDFRNLCKIDASKQMPSCERRITFADVEEVTVGTGDFVTHSALSMQSSRMNGAANGLVKSVLGDASPNGPKAYAFAVHGTAFLWHQVRCMVAILFLVGQGLEKPEIVDELLDISKNPGRPHYEMADDAPLVLWDCVFPGEGGFPGMAMQWLYAGDEANVSALPAKGDGKFGVGGTIETLWMQWREAKLKETVTASLLGLALSQGDGTPLQRGGYRDAAALKARSQKLFDGGDTPRLIGDYVPMMKRTKGETLEVINAKYLSGKQARRDAKKDQEVKDVPT